MPISSSSSEATDTRSFTGRTPSVRTGITSERGSNAKQKQRQPQYQPPNNAPASGFHFDMLAWYPKYQSCQRYFVDHSQHDVLVQAFAAFINILLPFQRTPPIFTSRGARSAQERLDEISAIKQGHMSVPDHSAVPVSLIPYIRRLVATGMDVPQILHGYFGNEWQAGIGPQRETERRNYLFAARSGDWVIVKRDYDMSPLETVPFLKPLMSPHEEEVLAAERGWSEWAAMEEWVMGNRSSEAQQ